MVCLSTKRFPGAHFWLTQKFRVRKRLRKRCRAAARFDLVHNPNVPYLTDSKFTPFSAPSRGGLYLTCDLVLYSLVLYSTVTVQ